MIGTVRVSEPEERLVLPHEDVMPHVVADRADLMRATSANLEPLLLTYRGDGTTAGTAGLIERTAAQPPLLSTTTEDGVHHRLWSLTDPADLAVIRGELSAHQALIADGHHRWATYLRLRAEHPPPAPGITAWSCSSTRPAIRCGSAPSTACCTACRSPRH